MAEKRDLTSATLLIRLRDPNDDEAWERCFRFYRNLILGYAVNRGCTEAMAWDVLQETLLSLIHTMPTFEYDPAKGRFRSFLLKIVRNRTADAFRRERKYLTLSESDRASRSNWILRIPDEHAENPADEWDRQWEEQLMLTALERVEERLEPLTRKAFLQYVIQNKPAERVCACMEIDRNRLYQIRHRVLSMVMREIHVLRGELGETEHDGRAAQPT